MSYLNQVNRIEMYTYNDAKNNNCICIVLYYFNRVMYYLNQKYELYESIEKYLHS